MWGIPYAEVIGSILWPVMISWPNAAFAVNILSQFIQIPEPAHWEGVKQLMTYLGSSKDLWLTFGS